MKKLIIYIGFILSLVISFLTGTVYESQKEKNYNEDIIRKEISLLEQYRNQPSCSEVAHNANKFYTFKDDKVIILWKYYPEIKTLEKVIINNEFLVAYDKLKVISDDDKCDFIQISDVDSNKH